MKTAETLTETVSKKNYYYNYLPLYISITILVLSSAIFFYLFTPLNAQEQYDYQYLRKWGNFGTGDSQFNFPENIESDNQGNLYVADTYNHRIQKFSSTGAYITQWGTRGSATGSFEYPYDIAINNATSKAYVTDTENNRIQVFDLAGTYDSQITSGYYYNSTFQNPAMKPYSAAILTPYGVAVDSKGRIYVTGWFERLTETVISSVSYSYNSDFYPGVQVFNSSHNLIQYAGWDVISLPNRFIIKGIDVDFQERVFLSNIITNKIQIHNYDGTQISIFGDMGTDPAYFNFPAGISVDYYGNVFVADKFNHRIQMFDSIGTYLTTIGSFGKLNGLFDSPAGVEIDPLGRVFVADTANDRVQAFKTGALTLNNGDQYTNTTAISIMFNNLNHASKYRARNDDTTAYSGWNDVVDSSNWNLPSSDGEKTVYVQVQDRYGNSEEEPLSDKIIIDTVPPTGSFSIVSNPHTSSQTVSLSLSINDTSSGVGDMRLSNDNSNWSDWEPYSASKTWLLLPGDGLKTVYAQVGDTAGNVISFQYDITLDANPPSGSISINNDETSTNDQNVQLALNANDFVSPTSSIDMRFSNNGTSWTPWENYSTSKTWSLSSGDGDKTVYVQFRDEYDNSSQYSSSILLDKTPPAGTVSLVSKYINTTSATLNFSNMYDNLTTVTSFRYSQDFAAISSAAWEPFSSLKNITIDNTEGEQEIYIQFKDGTGNTSTVFSTTAVYDKTKPVNVYITSPLLSTYHSLTSNKFTVKWFANDWVSGVKNYDVRIKVNNGNWINFLSGSALKAKSYSNQSGNTYYFQYRAEDKAGNLSGWLSSDYTIIPIDQDSMKLSSGWRKSTNASGNYMNTLRLSNKAGAYARYTTNAKGFYLLGTKGPFLGIAKIYINGTLVKSVNLYSSKTNYNEILFNKKWSSSASRTIKVIVSGKKDSRSTGTWVDLDGLGIFK